MSIRRAAAALGVVSLGLVALSSCEKPTPLATVTVGTKTVTTEAAPGCYQDGKALSQAVLMKCGTKKDAKTITVHPGETVRVGVEPAIADTGWYLIVGTAGKTGVSKQTYRTFPGDNLFTNGQTGEKTTESVLSVVETDKEGGKPRGVWQIKLQKATD